MSRRLVTTMHINSGKYAIEVHVFEKEDGTITMMALHDELSDETRTYGIQNQQDIADVFSVLFAKTGWNLACTPRWVESDREAVR